MEQESRTGSRGRPTRSDTVFFFQCQFLLLNDALSFSYRVPDTINVECRVDYQRVVEDVVPDVASIRKFNRVSWERKEPCRWVRHVGGDIIRVIAGGGFLIEVLKIGLASKVGRELERENVIRYRTILLEGK